MADRQRFAELLSRVVHGPPVDRDVEQAFGAYCDDLMGRAAPGLLLFFLVVVVVWWPSDWFIYGHDPESRHRMALARGIIVAQHLFWLTFGRKALVRRPALWGSFVAISETFMLALLAGLMPGGLDGPWPHYMYIWPLVAVALVRPLGDRARRVLLLAVGALAGFFLGSGTTLDHPHAASTISYMLFCTFFCTLVGHGVWLLLRENFVKQRVIDGFNQRLEQRVAEQTRDLQVLSQRLERLREEERAWMAREMHDALGQELTAARYAIDVVRGRLTAGERRLGLALGDIQQRVSMAHESVRQILQRLRPRVLDELGLPAALEWLARDTIEPAGLRSSVRCEPADARLSAELETAFYRVAQEAVTNAVRHAEASAVALTLTVDGGGCRLMVSDDGVGLAAARARDGAPDGVGCIGIRERVAALGGRARWETPTGGGTRLVVHIPLEVSC